MSSWPTSPKRACAKRPELLRTSAAKAIVTQTDVSQKRAVDTMLQQALDMFKTIDVLVNNAGIETRAPFLDLPEDDWDRVLDVNLKGPYLCVATNGSI
jgi:glucose 1-dehydrogenase